MLIIIEILFLVVGLWTLVSGKIPAGMFRLLFGKGEYKLAPDRARLFGLFLASPLPAALLVGFLLSAFVGERASGAAYYFEILYLVAVIVASLVIARRLRSPG